MKIDTNPENINCKEFIKNIFNLNSHDIEVYKKLRLVGETRADHLSKKLKKERSTVYRSLQKLTNSGLCIKNTKTIETGGYFHTYKCRESSEIKKEMKKCVEKWYTNMKKNIEIFEKEINQI